MKPPPRSFNDDPARRFPDWERLGEARRWLRVQARGKGAKCPCCAQVARVYPRTLNSGMASSLIRMYRIGGLEWVHLPTQLPARSREEGKLAYWGLIEEATEERRPDGGRAGWWRVTERGERFIRCELEVWQRLGIYDDQVVGPDKTSDPHWTIRKALGKRFDYDELMGATAADVDAPI